MQGRQCAGGTAPAGRRGEEQKQASRLRRGLYSTPCDPVWYGLACREVRTAVAKLAGPPNLPLVPCPAIVRCREGEEPGRERARSRIGKRQQGRGALQSGRGREPGWQLERAGLLQLFGRPSSTRGSAQRPRRRSGTIPA